MRSALALTQGDPSGIGPELALAAWERASRDPTIPAFFALCDPDHLARVAAALGRTVPIVTTTPSETPSVFPRALPVVPIRARVVGTAGQSSVDDAPATIESIERAVAFVMAGEAAAVVTNPIAKHVLTATGFLYPGHTEFLAALAVGWSRTPPLQGRIPPLQEEGGRRPGRVDFHAPTPTPTLPLSGEWSRTRAVMMLWCEDLAVVPVTIHVPLASVPRLLTRDLIIETAGIVAADLRSRFGIAAPRLVVSGLNPHAGENGTMGREEIDTIAPAVADLRAAGIDIRGPLPADTLFHAAARRTYDAALCMTHDQALIPIKTLAFDSAVNVTLGLPFVRTSPDHGTAFDIAGKGVADPSSLIAALRLARRLADHTASGAAAHDR